MTMTEIVLLQTLRATMASESLRLRLEEAKEIADPPSRSKGHEMFDEPIETAQQAKEFFRALGCSHFHMDREYPERSKEYGQLHISKQTETEWRKEQFDEYYVSIMGNQDASLLWKLHSRMYDLFEALETGTALIQMLQVTRHIRNQVPVEDRVIVAETINGRTVQSARTGLIYKAYDSGNIPVAREFAELSLHFSVYEEGKSRGKERCQRSAQLCKDIKLELGL
jgi:hypothetical protein